MNENQLTSESSSDFERQLAALAPQPSRLDRDGLMFQAGREAALREVALRDVAVCELAERGHTPRWLWPSAAGLLAAAASVLAVLLVIGRERVVDIQTVYVERPAATNAPSVTQRDDSDLAPAAAGTATMAGARGPWADRQSRGMLHARDMVLAVGVDSLPTSMSPRGQAGRGPDQSVASLQAELSGNRPPVESADESTGWLPQALSWPLGM